MQFIKNVLGLGLGCLLCVSLVHAANLTVEQKLADFRELTTRIEAGYGPLQYKKDVMLIDVAKLKADFEAKVAATTSNGAYYYLLVQFIASFQDSHFKGSLPTTQQATLPFSTDLVEDKVLIDVIDRRFLLEKDFPYVKGDEIVSWNGKPISTLLDELQLNINSGNPKTARRVAAMAVTNRGGATFPVPTGAVTFEVRRGTSAVIDPVTLNWSVVGEPIDEVGLMTNMGMKASFQAAERDFDMLSISDLYRALERPEGKQWERSFRCSGGTRIEIPKDATIIINTPFVAYYHPTPKGNVGYLRIPHYAPKNDFTGADESDLRFAQYEYAISVLEKNTVGLIIDQDHNCGGSVDWLHRVAGLFIATPFQPMQFQLLANKEEYLSFKTWMDGTNASTITYQGLKSVLNLIKTSWATGLGMTPKTSLDGSTAIYPHPIRYSKPIVMLIDEMSGSGGDAFPALLQGVGRAKLLGSRTMGAGGHVVGQPPLSYSQLKFNMTKSLFFRPDGVAVENNGAQPDFSYAMTRDDFMYGYRNYQAFYLSRLLALL